MSESEISSGNMPKRPCFGSPNPRPRKKSGSCLSWCSHGRKRRSRATALWSSAAVRQNLEPRKAPPRA